MIRFRADIEGLRAVAVLLVIFDHLSFRGFQGGFIGVDVFFVISGYLITSLLVAEYAEKAMEPRRRGIGSISIGGFYLRRARRILPAALAVIAAVLIAARMLLNSLRVAQVQHDAWWAALFGSNINFIRQSSNYFTAGLASSSPFRHYWSLAVEEQFYLVWPALLLVITAFHGLRVRSTHISWRRRLGIGLVVIFAASFIWSVHDTATNPASAYFSTLTRAWELALGALIAVATTQATRLGRRVAAAASFAGVGLLLIGCVVIDANSAFPGYIALLPTLGAGLLIVAGLTNAPPLPNRALSIPPMRFVGRISYSFYLWHWPIIVFAVALYPHASTQLPTRFGILVLTFVIATVSYYAIERPFRKLSLRGDSDWADRFFERIERGWKSAGFAIAALGGAALLGGLFVFAEHAGGGDQTALAGTGSGAAVSHAAALPHALPHRPFARTATRKTPASARAGKSSTYDQLLAHWQSRVRQSVHITDLPPSLQPLPDHLTEVPRPCQIYRLAIVAHEQECAWGNPNARYVAAITGDSHGGMWLTTLEGALNAQQWALHPFTRSWCGWSGGSEFVYSASERSANRDCPELQQQTVRELKRIHPDLLILSEYGVHTDQQMSDALSQLTHVAKHVVVLGHTPEIPSFITCLQGASQISACSGQLDQKALSDVAAEQRVASLFNVPFIDTTPWFCTGVTCPSVIDGAPAFVDGNHITAAIAPRLIPLLRAALKQDGALSLTSSAHSPSIGLAAIQKALKPQLEREQAPQQLARNP